MHDESPTGNFQVSFPGPFSYHDVVVNGWRVPLLQAHVHPDRGDVVLELDNRYSIELTAVEAEKMIPFIADAMAIALGYDTHPREGDSPPLVRAPHPKPQRTMTIVPGS